MGVVGMARLDSPWRTGARRCGIGSLKPSSMRFVLIIREWGQTGRGSAVSKQRRAAEKTVGTDWGGNTGKQNGGCLEVKATEVLKSEHRGIEKMLHIIREAAQKMLAGERVSSDIFEKAADFFSNFADRCHHGKEERHLFVRLAAKGIPTEGGPIGVMLSEHEAGRTHIRGMKKALEDLRAGRTGAERDLAEQALAYVQVLSAHIQKEDNVLFPMVDQALTDREQEELVDAFEQVEAQEMGEGVHEQYHQMIHALGEQVGGLGRDHHE